MNRMQEGIAEYIADIVRIRSKGDGTKHTYRPALKRLIETFDPAITATNEPARQRCGAPDYVLTKNQRPLGYIETKTVGKDLDSKEYKEQFERYLSALSNLIITDYLRFQFWQHGSKIAEITIGETRDGRIIPLKDNFAQFESLLRNFSTFTGTIINNADELTVLLARKAKILYHAVYNAINEEKGAYSNQSLHDQLEAFQNFLIPDLDASTFADVYAQTITYGMFVAKIHHRTGQTFSRSVAVECIPKSHPFLQKLFGYVAGIEIDERIRWVIDELADLLNAVHWKTVMENFGKSTQTEDPSIHFYEHFLNAYNPSTRKARGVYYTPLSAVRYIVDAIDEILTTDFGLSDGIATRTKIDFPVTTKEGKQVWSLHQVQILDPATGTGTFLAETVRHIHAKMGVQGQLGAWNRYVADDLLPRLHGFEILMAPYAVAHLKLDTILEQSGYRFEKEQRLGIYLTNALEEGIKEAEHIRFITWLKEEAQGANKVKIQTPVMVVFGNPPYNVSTMNKSNFANRLIEKYKTGLGEQNIQPLSDDYIKFIALGQHYIESNPSGSGILAYISNNSFLDGVIHRQMRKQLLETFDTIYILNLHGNARRKETTPDGGKDENVFNIMQGTSINIFVKLPATARCDSKGKRPQVFYVDLYGKRRAKYDFLMTQSLRKTGYKKLKPVKPYYFFISKDFSAQKEYEKGFSVKSLFSTSTSGVETKRDALFIDNDQDVLIKRMQTLLSGSYDWRFEEKYRVEDTNGYEIKRLLKGKKFYRQFIRQIEYRPFDRKWIYYDPDLLARAFYSTMQHLLNDGNFGLVVKRGFDEPNAAPVFVSKHIIDRRFWSRPGMQGAEHIAPLYVYPLGEKQPNLNVEIVTKIEQTIGEKVKPETLFDYVYGVLHSAKYRKDYEEFLKIDFPRVPYPEDAPSFRRREKFGEKLRLLHLLEATVSQQGLAHYDVEGSSKVEKLKYEGGKVWINDTQYFGNVPVSVWEFYIGGYQPAQKYLKDRKGRTLNYDEIEHYRKIICVLQETIEVMNEVDGVLFEQ